MDLEVKGKGQYQKLNYKQVGKVGSLPALLCMKKRQPIGKWFMGGC